ncbi:hypothetical protein BDN72DRAFT_836577 [Pluteus cervinus]|uniref:Uncharacterized protein n=1 Tax=Pluteus cervinus TaxID=181527 RepID=A0ACD3B3I4_9AGAR|nr:hypothetical protein BDN72DRAFT_836577 [Pluteus cervinus]
MPPSSKPLSQSSQQATLSSFFRSTSSTPSSQKKRRALSPIDLTGDDGYPPAKKSRVSTARGSPSRGSSRPTSDSRTSAAEQWRFSPVSPEKPSTAKPTPPRSQADEGASKLRHEKFKEKLLLENSKFRLKKSPEPIIVDDSDKEEDDGSDSDDAFKQLNALFTHKGKNKGKAKVPAPAPVKRPKKAVEVLGPNGQPYTPLELQVLQLKKENSGTVLMVEVGYKYKFFDNDAKVAAKELGMVAFNDRNFLVASIPTHRRDVHLKKLLAQGYRVGIVRQIETAALKKIGDNRNAPFERKLTHLFTAATYVDDLDSVDSVDRYTPPPFMCITEETKSTNGADVHFGMISICPSTGDVVWDDFEDGPMRIELETRLVHTRPTELLLPRTGLSSPTGRMLNHFTGVTSDGKKTRTELIDEMLEYDDAFSLVSDFYTDKKRAAAASESFKSGKLMAAITDFPKRVVIALAHAIKYLSAFNIADAFLETDFFTKFSTRAHMLLAANTLTNLEIYRNETDYGPRGSLVWVLDRTKTKFGARLLRSWVGRPLVDKRILQERVDAVEEILASSSEYLVSLRMVLKGLPDLAQGLCRIQYGRCTPEELAVLLPSFNKIANTFETMEKPSDFGFQCSLLNEILFTLPNLRGPIKKLLGAISVKEAAEGRKESIWTDPDRYPGIRDADLAIQLIAFELEEELKAVRKLLRMPSLKWTSIANDEYLIEVKKADRRPIPASWHCVSKTKYFERYQTPVIRQKLEERAQYQEKLDAEATNAFLLFLKEIAENHYSVMRDAVNKLATADCLLGFAQIAHQEGYTKPEFTDDDTLEIVNGRHPMVEVLREDPFVPNSIKMGNGSARHKIITGPNMGGKSSTVRMIALIAIMAQIGSYVPAESLKFGLLDSIHTRMGAFDDLARGRSTFMVEMTETSDILHSATGRSLVILDELGRGTSTFDGMAIADAVLQQLVQKTKCKTLFITHYPLVASSLERRFPVDIENLHMSYAADTRIDGTREITFLYRLTQGIATESFGIECGRLAGLPESILSLASDKASKMQEEVKWRRLQNLVCKSFKLVKKVDTETTSTATSLSGNTVEELRKLVEALRMTREGY